MNSLKFRIPMKIWRICHGSLTSPNGKALHSFVALSSGTVYDSWPILYTTNMITLTTIGNQFTHYFIWTIGWIWICIVLINIQSVSIQGLCLVETVGVFNIFNNYWTQLFCCHSTLRLHCHTYCFSCGQALEEWIIYSQDTKQIISSSESHISIYRKLR